jgi:hypothetical protein
MRTWQPDRTCFSAGLSIESHVCSRRATWTVPHHDARIECGDLHEIALDHVQSPAQPDSAGLESVNKAGFAVGVYLSEEEREVLFALEAGEPVHRLCGRAAEATLFGRA